LPPERTFERKKTKAIKAVENKIVKEYKEISERLLKLKNEVKEKLYDERILNSIGALLNVWGLNKTYLIDSLDEMEWLYDNSQKDLKQIFNVKWCKEIKDQFLQVLTENELYKLYTFIDEVIEIHEMDFYYDIPPYNPNMKGVLRMPDFFDDDDDD
jgi:hypothetical protein